MALLPLILSVVISVLYYSTGTWAVTLPPPKTAVWRTSSKAPTTTPPPMFISNHERDNFIMQLNTEMLSVKTILNSLYGQINHLLTNPPILGGQSQKGFVAFMVRLTNRLTRLGQDQIIHFDDVILNKGNGFDTRVGVFRCPLAGTYQFSVSIGSYGGIQLEIVNNGQQIGRVFTSGLRYGRSVEDEDEEANEKEGEEVNEDDEKSVDKRAGAGTGGGGYYTTPWYYAQTSAMATTRGTEATQGSAQAVVDLKVGDEVWVRHASDNSYDILLGNGMTTFSGHLLGTTKK